MSIISCYTGFDFHQINVDEYIETIKQSISEIDSFNIEFRGLTTSPSCLMVQGFLEDNTLNKIRNNLRAAFKSTSLEQSIDSRYVIQTAHTTILRLKERFNDKERFLEMLEEYRGYYFGMCNVDSLELVFNDWYQRKENVKKLYSFKLG